MRFLLSFGGAQFLMFLGDALTKTIHYGYLHADITPDSVSWGWAVVGCTLVFGALLLWFLYGTIGKAACKWRNSPFPARGEVWMGAFLLPTTLCFGGALLKDTVEIARTGEVPLVAMMALGSVLTLFLAMFALQLHSFISDARQVRRLGWGQIEQMEGARLHEEGAGRWMAEHVIG